MSDCMTFPDTVEEFMDSYKIVDAEKVYTNGTEMVPIYRMRQWFQHKPERKKGKWLKSYADHEAFGIRPFFRYCSECNEATVHAYNFCPNCGADMRGDNDD